MKHTDYTELTRALEFLASNAARTRAIMTMPLAVTKDGAIVATSTPDQDGTPFDTRGRAGEMWRAVETGDSKMSERMDGLVDGWTEGNQDRADEGMEPTADARALLTAMEGFISATETPVERWGILYKGTRDRCRAWINQASEWYPNYNADRVNTDQAPRPTSTPATVTIDREKMAAIFIGKYKIQPLGSDHKPLPSDFDMLCNAIQSGAEHYTPTDFGRIAYQVYHSKMVLSTYQPGKMTFADFIRLFFDACGVEVPADIAPSRYAKKTKKIDYSEFLK